MSTFINIPTNSDFSIHNIPFGVFHLKTETPSQARCASRIGDSVVDLSQIESQGHFKGPLMSGQKVFNQTTLNSFMELTREHWREVRNTLQNLFSTDNTEWATAVPASIVYSVNDVHMVLPARIGDYTDFYSSKNHAYNVGVMFRGPENALQPNWTWMPIGYHGRSSSIVVSGTDLNRPMGQTLALDANEPKFTKAMRCDFELEMGVFYGGKSNGLGNRLDINKAEENLFGMVLLNDWSARDLQKWEYVPLGPFTAKNFGSSISPWIVTLDALEPFRCKIEEQNPPPLEYLIDPKFGSYDINLTVALKTETNPKEQLLATSNFKYMYWSMAQQVTHHSVSGCNLVAGDLYGSGTISGPEKHEYGSMLELCWGGKEEIKLENEEVRKFLKDNDEVVMKGHCEKDGVRVGFGEVRGKLLPSKE